MNVEGKELDEMTKLIKKMLSNAPHVESLIGRCRVFNLMFKTFQGAVEDSTSVVYLRPETTQASLLTSKMLWILCG